LRVHLNRILGLGTPTQPETHITRRYGVSASFSDLISLSL